MGFSTLGSFFLVPYRQQITHKKTSLRFREILSLSRNRHFTSRGKPLEPINQEPTADDLAQKNQPSIRLLFEFYFLWEWAIIPPLNWRVEQKPKKTGNVGIFLDDRKSRENAGWRLWNTCRASFPKRCFVGGKSVILFFHKVFSCRIDRNAKERHASVSPISFDDFLPFFRNSNLLGLAQHVGNRGDAMWISQSPTFFTDIFREKKSLLVSPCLFRNEGTRTIGLEIFSHFLTRDNFTDIFKIPHLPLFFSRLCWKEKEEGVFQKN